MILRSLEKQCKFSIHREGLFEGGGGEEIAYPCSDFVFFKSTILKRSHHSDVSDLTLPWLKFGGIKADINNKTMAGSEQPFI